jgi:protein-L-isoaspartate(D-aspartate) O-methyltransferase
MVPPEARKQYAEEIRTTAKIASEALINAFAAVPREEFVGEGPWTILSRPAPGQMQPQLAEVTDPRELYQDVAVFLDHSKGLTNGNPSTLAPWLDSLNLAEGKSVFHLGCGSGYYTAVIAETVGRGGSVTATEIDPSLAAQARKSLARYPQVEVVEGDGGAVALGKRDAILINAGVTHPAGQWLENMNVGGTMVAPLTIDVGVLNVGKGLVLCVSRLASAYAAYFLPAPVMIYSCKSIRDSTIAGTLGQKLMAGTFGSVRSLRREPHTAEPSCWLHSDDFCLSTEPVSP